MFFSVSAFPAKNTSALPEFIFSLFSFSHLTTVAKSSTTKPGDLDRNSWCCQYTDGTKIQSNVWFSYGFYLEGDMTVLCATPWEQLFDYLLIPTHVSKHLNDSMSRCIEGCIQIYWKQKRNHQLRQPAASAQPEKGLEQICYPTRPRPGIGLPLISQSSCLERAN